MVVCVCVCVCACVCVLFDEWSNYPWLYNPNLFKVDRHGWPSGIIRFTCSLTFYTHFQHVLHWPWMEGSDSLLFLTLILLAQKPPVISLGGCAAVVIQLCWGVLGPDILICWLLTLKSVTGFRSVAHSCVISTGKDESLKLWHIWFIADLVSILI